MKNQPIDRHLKKVKLDIKNEGATCYQNMNAEGGGTTTPPTDPKKPYQPYQPKKP